MTENGSGVEIETRRLPSRILERLSPFKKRNEPSNTVRETDKSSTSWTFQGDALRVWVIPLRDLPEKFTENFQLPSDVVVGKIDFPRTRPTTLNNAQLIAYNRDTLDTGLKDLQVFFTSLDKEKLMPEYLIGRTSSTMARATRRFGFKILKEGNVIRVVGKTATVRKKFETILAKAASRGRTRTT